MACVLRATSLRVGQWQTGWPRRGANVLQRGPNWPKRPMQARTTGMNKCQSELEAGWTCFCSAHWQFAGGTQVPYFRNQERPASSLHAKGGLQGVQRPAKADLRPCSSILCSPGCPGACCGDRAAWQKCSAHAKSHLGSQVCPPAPVVLLRSCCYTARGSSSVAKICLLEGMLMGMTTSAQVTCCMFWVC